MHFGTIEGAGMFLKHAPETAVFRLPAFPITKLKKQSSSYVDNNRIHPQLMNNELQWQMLVTITLYILGLKLLNIQVFRNKA